MPLHASNYVIVLVVRDQWLFVAISCSWIHVLFVIICNKSKLSLNYLNWVYELPHILDLWIFHDNHVFEIYHSGLGRMKLQSYMPQSLLLLSIMTSSHPWGFVYILDKRNKMARQIEDFFWFGQLLATHWVSQRF